MKSFRKQSLVISDQLIDKSMSTWKSRSFTDIVIELHVPDFKKVKSFYKKLGFKVIWERKPRDVDGYLVMKRGDSLIGFYCGNKSVYKHQYFSKFPKTSPKGYAVEISVPVKNIKKFYSSVLKNFGKKYIVSPLKIQPYDIQKKKDFRIKDCFGFYLRFTDPINIFGKE